MLKKTCLLLIIMFLFLSACSNDSLEVSNVDPDGSEQTQPNIFPSVPMPYSYENEDELLAGVGMTKFGESINPQGRTSMDIEALQGLKELYKPGYIKPDFVFTGMAVWYINRVAFYYDDIETGEHTLFNWYQSTIPLEDAVTSDFGRGAAAEYIEERNGITYGVVELNDFEADEHVAYGVSWAQHGQVFRVSIPASFTLEEVLTFCDAQPIDAWELDGDAVSASIQGMENVSIYNGDNNIIAEDDVLYRANTSGNMERVGYRWLIDKDTSRYQYVLEPGAYTFNADGVISNPELLVKHFETGEIVSNADYSKELSGQPFSLTVTPNPDETKLIISTPNYDIIITSVETGNGQANINFAINSANGKGYTIYLSETGNEGSFKPYSDVNYNSKGAHIKGLTNGKKYYTYVEYNDGKGGVTRSAVVSFIPSK